MFSWHISLRTSSLISWVSLISWISWISGISLISRVSHISLISWASWSWTTSWRTIWSISWWSTHWWSSHLRHAMIVFIMIVPILIIWIVIVPRWRASVVMIIVIWRRTHSTSTSSSLSISHVRRSIYFEIISSPLLSWVIMIKVSRWWTHVPWSIASPSSLSLLLLVFIVYDIPELLASWQIFWWHIFLIISSWSLLRLIFLFIFSVFVIIKIIVLSWTSLFVSLFSFLSLLFPLDLSSWFLWLSFTELISWLRLIQWVF